MVQFIAVGFFISVLIESGYTNILLQPFALLAEKRFLLFVSIQCLFSGLAMVGFHPLVTISISGQILEPFIPTIKKIKALWSKEK
jgi:hypothetical protein